MRLLEPKLAFYRLYDVADEIELSTLDWPRAALRRPRSPIKLAEPPAELALGRAAVAGHEGELRARVFPFGVVSIRLLVPLGPVRSLEATRSLALSLEPGDGVFEGALKEVVARLRPALYRPLAAPGEEEFSVFFFSGTEPSRPASRLLHELDFLPLVLGETEVFSPQVREELLRMAFSYTEEDLAVLGFERLLLYDSEGVWDVADLVEFVHAEILELAYYDRLLTRQLADLPEALARYSPWRYRHYERLRRRLMQVHAEVTEVRARMEAALKITEDFFYARVYRAAAELYGAQELAETTREKLLALSTLYEMITEEQNFARAQAVEVGIFALILFEVIRALL